MCDGGKGEVAGRAGVEEAGEHKRNTVTRAFVVCLSLPSKTIGL